MVLHSSQVSHGGDKADTVPQSPDAGSKAPSPVWRRWPCAGHPGACWRAGQICNQLWGRAGSSWWLFLGDLFTCRLLCHLSWEMAAPLPKIAPVFCQLLLCPLAQLESPQVPRSGGGMDGPCSHGLTRAWKCAPVLAWLSGAAGVSQLGKAGSSVRPVDLLGKGTDRQKLEDGFAWGHPAFAKPHGEHPVCCLHPCLVQGGVSHPHCPPSLGPHEEMVCIVEQRLPALQRAELAEPALGVGCAGEWQLLVELFERLVGPCCLQEEESGDTRTTQNPGTEQGN